LDSKEYLEIRTALIVLKQIVKYFPKLTRHVSPLERRLNKIKEDEREGLKVLASRYSALLEAEAKNMLSDADFHHQPPDVKAPSNLPQDLPPEKKLKVSEKERPELPPKKATSETAHELERAKRSRFGFCLFVCFCF
jgi:THO complex subunit 2